MLLALCVKGQEASDEPVIQATLTGIALERRVSDLYLRNGKEYQQINFYPGVRSASVAYEGPREISLFTKGKNVEGETTWVPVASTLLQGFASDYLLFVSRNSTSSPVKMLALPEDLADFKTGSYRFVNLTEKNIALKLGEERASIRPLNFADVSSSFKHGTSYESLLVELPEGDASPQLIYSTSLYYNERVRMLYLISPVEGTSKVKLTGIPQQ
ncbi:hypothetical protein QEH59_16830 [Coraliomargarita sp. SDUM461004]|uniref:DUF4397 domain-containing protein n=1 Tax=Thalassobacterium sedimentorum TaxID=3041258 RepID=A0ABU1AN20_9BACT|nr:hypothetical protein [Coraliomargarita sp. SDUM461004]MDQ8196102.1 hypothetical protein [Coraliomargarita sp. SDUM461004]